MKTKLFAVSAFFALLGAEVPQWFSKPALDSNHFYGFGVGSSIDVAKKNSMVDLASSLQSSVKVVFEREIKRNDVEISSNASQKFSIDTTMTDLMSIEAKNAECIDQKCYVVVEIAKPTLLKQLKQKIEVSKQALDNLKSPFDYQHKKDVLYPKILMDYALYTSLGGVGVDIPKSAGEKPSFDVRFNYDGSFSSGFKSIFEKTIEDALTRFGSISANSQYKIDIEVYKEGESVAIEFSASDGGEIVHNSSVFDTKKTSISNSFFAKRLGVQVYKKMQKWGTK